MKPTTILIIVGVGIVAILFLRRSSATTSATIVGAGTVGIRPGVAAAPPSGNVPAGAPPVIARAENAAMNYGTKAINLGVQSAIFIPKTSVKIGISAAKKIGTEIYHGFGLW